MPNVSCRGIVLLSVAALGWIELDGAVRVQTREAPAASRAAYPPLDVRERRQIALQVALDRAGFSPGEIDGRDGPNTRQALTAAGARIEAREYESAVTVYQITPADVAGPFLAEWPADMMAQARLGPLAYLSVLELLAERFHVHPELLLRMNPGVALEAGQSVTVPDVEPFVLPEGRGRRAAGRAAATAAQVVVTEATGSLEVVGPGGDVMFHAPVTVGSSRDPLPIGQWKVTGVYDHPVFHYNPALFWDADPGHARARLAPGPNNPVGPIWIDISKEHYGFHGTPEPSTVGHTQSHGCIRLTNWDVTRLAALVRDGMEVVFR